jgi:hypothetical protein
MSVIELGSRTTKRAMPAVNTEPKNTTVRLENNAKTTGKKNAASQISLGTFD